MYDNDFAGRKKAVDCENYSKSKVNVPSERAKERGRVKRAIYEIEEAIKFKNLEV